MRKKDIDKVDLQILSILEKSAAITNKDLAENLGLSAPPTLHRVNTLREKGIITNYSVNIDYTKLKFTHCYVVRTKVRSTDVDAALKMGESIPWIETSYYTKVPGLTKTVLITSIVRCPNAKIFKETLENVMQSEYVLEITSERIQKTVNRNNTFADIDSIYDNING